MTPPRVLVIGGSDSSACAGIQADVRTVTALGGFATTAITAVTAQNSFSVSRIAAIEPDLVVAQMDAVLGDIGADAIKIGMIGSPAVAEVVAARLSRPDARVPIVFDPVMVATSGGTLADADTVQAFDQLMRMATLVTPNLPELDVLAGGDAAALSRRIGAAVLVKGGHGAGDEVGDELVLSRGAARRWTDTRLPGSFRGTGCTLASAAAVGLAAHLPLAQAVERARRYVRAAMLAAPALGERAVPLSPWVDFD